MMSSPLEASAAMEQDINERTRQEGVGDKCAAVGGGDHPLRDPCSQHAGHMLA